MQKTILTISLFALAFKAFGFAASEVQITQRLPDNSSFIVRSLPVPAAGASALFLFDGGTAQPTYTTLGSGLTLSSGALTATAASQVNSDWNSVSGVSQILNKPSIPTVPSNVSAFANDSGYVTQAGARSALSATGSLAYNSATGVFSYTAPSLATVATSGAYADLTGKPTIPAAQVSSDWSAVSGIAQILNKPSLSTVATTGAYSDLTGKPSIPSTQIQSDWTQVSTGALDYIKNKPAARSQSSPSRSLNTIFQISSTRDSSVAYSVQLTVTASIAGGQNGDVILEIASDSGFTTNVQTLSIFGGGQTYTLAVALQGVQPQTGVISGYVPAGYYARLRTVNNTGTPAFLYRAGQEVLL